MQPKISVIMPVYNGERYLRESIESVIGQTFKDFEFIIINDGSKDNSLKIIEEYRLKDNRIKIIEQENSGVIQALNNGIKIAKGEYIARMDADDVSLPERLEKQIFFLEKEKAVLCGSWAITINEEGKEIDKMNYPKSTWLKNKLYLLRGNPFIHPTVMFKKEEIVKIGLYKNHRHIEDYELWTRVVSKYKSINIPEYLLKYRIHNDQITKKTNCEMRIRGIQIRLLALLRLIKSIF